MSEAPTKAIPTSGPTAASGAAPSRRSRSVRATRATIALTALALALPTGAAASVLVVGDSLGVGTEGSLRSALGGVPVDADSANGRPSAAGLPILADALGPQHHTVVFDLGTNDGNSAISTTAASLASARQLTGNRCLVIATLNRPPLNGVPIDGQNEMIRRFAATTPNVALVDWNEVAATTPGVLQADGVHATAGGYALRGLLFADAIAGCTGARGGGAGAAGTGAADPPPQAAASTTAVPARERRRQPAPRRPQQRKRPSLAERVADAAVAGLTGAAGPLGLAERGGGLLASAAAKVGAAATPRGPEPVLGEDAGSGSASR